MAKTIDELYNDASALLTQLTQAHELNVPRDKMLFCMTMNSAVELLAQLHAVKGTQLENILLKQYNTIIYALLDYCSDLRMQIDGTAQ